MANKKKQKKQAEYVDIFELTEQAIDKLETEKIPSDIITKLKILRGKEYSSEKKFLRALKKKIGQEKTDQFKSRILKKAKQNVKKEKDYFFIFRLTEKAIEKLKQENVPTDLLAKFKKMKNEEYTNKKKFVRKLWIKVFLYSLKNKVDRDHKALYKNLIFEESKKRIYIVNYRLTDKAYKKLKDNNVPKDIISNLKSLHNKKYATKNELEDDLKKTLGKDKCNRYKGVVFRCSKISKLTSFIITEESLNRLTDVIPSDISGKLESLKNIKFWSKKSLINKLNKKLGAEKTRDNKALILRHSKTIYREYVESIIVALLAALVLRIFVIQAFRIPTGSMKDTLLIGDFLLVNKFIYGVRTPDRIPLIDVKIPYFNLPAFKEPKRGDIIVFKYPKGDSLDYIKRCIALPGQVVEVRNGEVFVDGKPEGKLEKTKQKYDPEEGYDILYYQVTMKNGKKYTIRHHKGWQNENYGPTKVPKGHYFMMGDNRDNSADSRSWGFLPRDNIVGEALIIYWSWDKNVTLYPLHRIIHKIRWLRIANLIR